MTNDNFQSKTAFVGLGGTNNNLKVTHQPDRVLLQLTGFAYLIVLAATLLFGPVLLTLLYLRPPGTIDLSKVPLPFAALILALPVICCVLFVSYLFTQHRIEVLQPGGTMVFYKRKLSGPVYSLEKHRIRDFVINESWYRPSRGGPTKNFVLTAICDDERRLALCISTDEKLIQSVEQDLRSLTGVR